SRSRPRRTGAPTASASSARPGVWCRTTCTTASRSATRSNCFRRPARSRWHRPSGRWSSSAGGVGITPTLAMLEAALKTSRLVHFIHFARDRSAHAFRQLVDGLAQNHPQLRRFYCYDVAPDGAGDAERPHAVGRVSVRQLSPWLPAQPQDIDAYFLGPKPFMQEVKKALRALGVPDAQVRYEFFCPAPVLA